MQTIMARIGEMVMPGGKPPVEDFPWLGYKYYLLLSSSNFTEQFLSYLPDCLSPWKARSKELGDWMNELYEGEFTIYSAMHLTSYERIGRGWVPAGA